MSGPKRMSPINETLVALQHRAERIDAATLVDTFVEVGPLAPLLSRLEHQILFGRRGTGKTHALQYMLAKWRDPGDAAVYLDMRVVGSAGSLYADERLSIEERGTRFLIDTLKEIRDQLVDAAFEAFGDQAGDTLNLLSELEKVIINVRVVGENVERTTRLAQRKEVKKTAGLDLRISLKGPGAGLGFQDGELQAQSKEVFTHEVGQEEHTVHFGDISGTLKKIAKALTGEGRIWIVLDEWSAVPYELQPIVADLIRRAVFTVENVTVKIGAIEYRSHFRRSSAGRAYVGIEVGADAPADANLDEFMVFGIDPERATEFFSELLYKHVRASLVEKGRVDEAPTSAKDLIQRGFTGRPAFRELVRAAEGVPRDAMYIASMAAQRAMDRLISVDDVRAAARRFYQVDKEQELSEESKKLLIWIIEKVIGARRARAFLLRQGSPEPLIGYLNDQRILHVMKKGIGSKDEAGVRYDVYSIDYGCYVDMMTTAAEPRGLLEVELEDGSIEYVDVPPDDYRAIRRAILDPVDFHNSLVPSE